MIRFVDLTPFYWTLGGKPCCAFLDTVTDTFINADYSEHTFDSALDVDCILDPELRERCAGLVPAGFWEANDVDALKAARNRIDQEIALLVASAEEVSR